MSTNESEQTVVPIESDMRDLLRAKELDRQMGAGRSAVTTLLWSLR
jgi:hypothetical protein